MKKNKYYGMNVKFDGLCVDFGRVSLNKKKETLCGDYYTIIERDEEHVLVLSDGLGSGVKANILSTLTAKMLSTMVSRHLPLEEAVRAVAKTLPICSVRQMAYSTFTVLDIKDGVANLSQFDNPDAILIRDGKVFDYPISVMEIDEKVIHLSSFALQEEDMLILMSDGVTNAGMGKTTDGGWGRPDVVRFCQNKYRPGMTAQEMAGNIAAASVDLNLNETDDDITVVVLRFRKPQKVNLMIGPPRHANEDEKYLKSFFESEGMHVVCGGTTAKFAARYLGKELRTIQDSSVNDVPARSRLEGVELVTEGLLTMERLLEYCNEVLENSLSFNEMHKKKDAAAYLGRMLFETATEVRIFYGNAINPDHEKLNISPEHKEKLVEELAAHLRNAGKKVSIGMWAV